MKKTLAAGLMFLSLFVQTHEDNESFYIVPNLHSNPNCSYDQSCLTFQQFVNSDTYISLENVTLVFLTGYHTFTEEQYIPEEVLYYMSNTYLTMVGISTEVVIHDIEVSFIFVQKLHIENLTLNNGLFYMSKTLQINLISVTSVNYVIFIVGVTLAQLYNCEFSNGTSQLYIDKSKVILCGNSRFFNNRNSALVALSSIIILSGTTSFVNNSGVRGGAMGLYSSTIYPKSGLNMSFINNSAEETGGAILIEPDMTRNYYPECFYHIQDYATGITFYYYKNSAQFGGDNIYGTSLLCLCGDDVSHYFLLNATMSSVSSNPTQVCLCDSDGQPQCKSVSNNGISKSIYPGETFIVSAVLVGGDYGTTIGAVHASFIPINVLTVPLHQYSQWIDNNSACRDLQYTVYSNQFGRNITMYLTVYFSKHLEIINPTDKRCDTKHNFYLSAPTPISLTILPCPMGFSLLEQPSRCGCNPILLHNGVKCELRNGKSYFSWNSTLWINVTHTGFTYTKYCPLHYCNPAGKQIELKLDPSVQCAFN